MPVRTKKKIGKVKKGSRYSCRVCGLSVKVDNICGCIDTCDIICCGKEIIQKE